MVLHDFKDSSRVNNKLRAGSRRRRTLPVKTDPSRNIEVSGEVVGALGSETLRELPQHHMPIGPCTLVVWKPVGPCPPGWLCGGGGN